MAYEIKHFIYVKGKMTYISGMCLRTSLKGRVLVEIDFNRICVKVCRFISKFRVSRLAFIEKPASEY